MNLSVLREDLEHHHHILTLAQGPWAGKPLTTLLKICPSPLCECLLLTFECSPLESAPAPEGSTPAHTFTLNIQTQQLEGPADAPATPESRALGQALLAELTPDDTQSLADYFWTHKQALIDHADATQLDAEFPTDVFFDPSVTVGFGQLFPCDRGFTFDCAGTPWMADDHYVVNPQNATPAVILTFVEVKSGNTLPQKDDTAPAPAAIYNYSKGSFKMQAPPQPGQPPVADLMKAVKAAHADLDARVKKRHDQMRTLFIQAFMKLKQETVPYRKPEPKIGRNDPCPCGSGKKYKKCCEGKTTI